MSTFVRDWNGKYAFPKLVIATTREMMQELERRYGDQLPEFSGDFTPYWEDGAASSARETALNRAAAERLVQAETLFALREPAKYPELALREAWRNVVLYDEHTWGAHCSISEPESDFTEGPVGHQAEVRLGRRCPIHQDLPGRARDRRFLARPSVPGRRCV